MTKQSHSKILYFLLVLILLTLITPTLSAKKPSDDGNWTIISEDDFDNSPFKIKVLKDDKQLLKDEIQWLKKNDSSTVHTIYGLQFIDGAKYGNDGKLKDPLPNITFRVAPGLITNRQDITYNQYYSTYQYDLASFDTFKAKNIITNETITPIYYGSSWETFWEIFMSMEWGTFLEFQQFMTTPYAYDVTFFGSIDDLDPELTVVYGSTSNLFLPNQTEASVHGARLIYNGTNQTGYNSSAGDFSSFVFFNSTPTSWNITMNIADSDGSQGVYNLCEATASCVSYWSLDETYRDSSPNGAKGNSIDFTPNDYANTKNATLIHGSEEMTLETWLHADAWSAYDGIIVTRSTRVTGLAFSSAENAIIFRVAGATETFNKGYTFPDADLLGNWHHIVGTYSNNSGTKVYVNGELVGFREGAMTEPLYQADVFRLGWDDGNIAYRINAKMDETRIYNRAITAEEVLDSYNKGAGTYGSPDVDGLLQGYHMDESSGLVVENYVNASQNATGIGNLWRAGKVKLNYNDGTQTGTNNATGLSSGAMEFNGADYITTPGLIVDTFNDYSISAWARPLDITAQRSVFGFNENGGATDENAVGIQVYDGDWLIIDERHNTQVLITTPATINEWAHVVVTAERNGDLTFYLNGVEKTSGSTIGDRAVDQDLAFLIGARTADAKVNTNWTGDIDELLIYDDLLTASEITALYKAGLSQHAVANITLETRNATSYNLTDPSLVSMWGLNNNSLIGETGVLAVDQTGRFNGTIVGSTWSEEDGVVGGGYSFDGSSDYINISEVGVNMDTSNGTIAMWVNRKFPDGNPNNKIIASFRVDSNNNIEIFYDASIDDFIFKYKAGGTTKQFVKDEEDIPQDTWTHLAQTWDNSSDEFKLYIDGVQSGATLTGLGSWAGDISIGHLGVGLLATPRSWNGSIDEVRIYNRSLSATEILDLYELGQAHILWSDWTDAGVMTDGVPNNNTGNGNFIQFKANFLSDSTAVSPYLLNHSVMSTEEVGVDVPPTVSDITYQNETGVEGGIVLRGADITINATVTDIEGVSAVWIKIWEDAVESNIIFEGFLNLISGDLWSIDITTNTTFSLGENNYTIFANDTTNQITQENATFDLERFPDIEFVSPTEPNNTFTPRNNIYAEVSHDDTNAVNLTFTLSNTTGIVNITTYAPDVYVVTGSLTPDATGTYLRNGYEGGKPAYEREDGAYWLYYGGCGYSTYALSDNAGDCPMKWLGAADTPDTTYSTFVGGSGTATAKLRDFINWTGLSYGEYFYKANITDASNLSNFTETRTITIIQSIPNITDVLYQNESGSISGTIVKGDNVTINATVTDLVESIDSVWIKVWQGSIGIPAIIFEGFMNFITGDLWSIDIETNDTFNLGENNFTIYANDTLGNQTEINSTFLMNESWTSLLGVKFNLSDFPIDSSTYIKDGSFSFNTSLPNESLIIVTAMNVRNNVGGSGSIDISLNVTGDGDIQLAEGKLSTVTWSGNNIVSKSTGLSAIAFVAENPGIHNISFWFKRTGSSKEGLVYDIDLSMGKFETLSGGNVTGIIEDIIGSTSSTTLEDIQNFSMTKDFLSKDYHITSITLTATGATTAVCRFREGSETSPFIVRTITGAGDTGTAALPYMEPEDEGSHITTLECLSTTGETLSVSGSFLEFNLKDNETNVINAFQSGNASTNWTDTILLTAGLHQIAKSELTFKDDGDSLFIGGSMSIASTSGTQTPKLIINSTIDGGTCTSEKDRTTSGDVGNVFTYFICKDNPLKGESHNVTMYLEVPAGETIEVYDESLAGFEISSFDISQLNTPPIVTINFPQDGVNISGITSVNWTVTDLQASNYNSNITANNGTTTIEIALNQPKPSGNVTWDTTAVTNGLWNITVFAQENETLDLFNGSDTHMINILNNATSIQIQSPNETIIYENTTDMGLNFTSSNIPTECLYSLNGAANVTITPCTKSTNTTFNNSIEGINTLRLFVDSAAGSDVEVVTFDVNTQPPTLLIFPVENEWEKTEAITLTSYCRYASNDTVCASGVVCRATAHYPNGSILIADQQMTYGAGGVYTYSVGYTNISQNYLGAYSSAVSCYDGSDQEAAFTFWVLIEKNEQAFLYGLLFFTALILIIFGEWRNNWVFKYMGGSLLAFIGVWLFIYGIPGHTLSYLGSGNSDAWISWISWILMGAGILYFVKSAYEDYTGGEHNNGT